MKEKETHWPRAESFELQDATRKKEEAVRIWRVIKYPLLQNKLSVQKLLLSVQK